MANRTAKVWSAKDDSVLKDLFENGKHTYRQITRQLKKATGKNSPKEAPVSRVAGSA